MIPNRKGLWQTNYNLLPSPWSSMDKVENRASCLHKYIRDLQYANYAELPIHFWKWVLQWAWKWYHWEWDLGGWDDEYVRMSPGWSPNVPIEIGFCSEVDSHHFLQWCLHLFVPEQLWQKTEIKGIFSWKWKQSRIFSLIFFFCKRNKIWWVLTCKHITIIRLYKAHITTFCLSVNIFFTEKNYNSKSKHAFLFVVLESQSLYQLLWHRKSRNPSWQLVVRYWRLY